MLAEKSMVKVHFCDYRKFPDFTNEIKTRNYDKIFEVKKHNNKLGIDWNTEQSVYMCKEDIFTPFNIFAWTVIFEDVQDGKLYHYSNTTNTLEEI